MKTITTKNAQRKSPRISVSMTHETFEALTRHAQTADRSVSYLVAQTIAEAVALWELSEKQEST